jgi:hypothetical protein
MLKYNDIRTDLVKYVLEEVHNIIGRCLNIYIVRTMKERKECNKIWFEMKESFQNGIEFM